MAAAGVLVVEGEPGIGKSALLDWATRASIRSACGAVGAVEVELELPYGALGHLLRPLHGAAAKLDEGHMAALSAVFAAGGVVGETPRSFQPDRFAVGAATLALLADVSEAGPLLVVMDDAHWLDQSSAEALAFMARRLLAEGILLLLSKRAGEGHAALTPFRASSSLGGACRGDRAAAGRRRPAAEHRTRQAAHPRVDGNPLALAELPRLVAADELAGPSLTQAAADRRAADERVCGPVLTTADRCRQAAAIVAMLSAPGLQLAEGALQAADLSVNELAAAEDAGLIELNPSGVSFRHPLARSAAAYSVPGTWRRRCTHRLPQRWSTQSTSTSRSSAPGTWLPHQRGRVKTRPRCWRRPLRRPWRSPAGGCCPGL